MRPLAAGQEVAEPLVGEFVCRDRVAELREILVCPRVVEQHVGHRRRRGVLHPAENEVRDGHRVVFRPRVGRADPLGEEAHHRWRTAEGAPQRRPAPRGAVVGDRDLRAAGAGTRGALLDGDQLTCDERHQVGGVRALLAPVVDGAATAPILSAGGEAAVGEHEPPGRHRRRELGGRLLTGVVEAGEVVGGVLCLSLGPDLPRPVGIVGVRGVEVEPAARARPVAHHRRDAATGRSRTPEVDVERALAEAEREGTTRAVGHRLDVELPGVEDGLAQPGGPRAEGGGRDAVQFAAREIEGELQRDVLDGEGPVASPHRTVAGEGEGVPAVCGRPAAAHDPEQAAAGDLREQTPLAFGHASPLRHDAVAGSDAAGPADAAPSRQTRASRSAASEAAHCLSCRPPPKRARSVSSQPGPRAAR